MDRELWVDDPQLVHWRLPSCAVVGNSGRLRVEHHAARIDAHDIVIRFNQGKTQTFEHLVGRKSSFRMFNGPYVGPKQGGEVTIAQVCTRSLSVVPQPARAPPLRTQPSYAVSHPADACHRALGGAQHSAVPILSERSAILFGISEKRGTAPHLRPLQAGAPHCSFGTYLEMPQCTAVSPCHPSVACGPRPARGSSRG